MTRDDENRRMCDRARAAGYVAINTDYDSRKKLWTITAKNTKCNRVTVLLGSGSSWDKAHKEAREYLKGEEVSS